MNPAAIAMLFIAFHMIGDFVTQTQWMANRKLEDWWARTIHVFVYSFPFWVLAKLTLTDVAGFWFVFALFIPHWIIDCRRWASGDAWPAKPIMVDQSLHALHLAIVFAVFYG